MRLFNVLWSRLQSLLLRGRREADLREELALHIDRETERLVASGMAPDMARRQALRAFGGIEEIKEACRDARGTAVVEGITRDARHGMRRLTRDWRFTAAAVLILGLGIGVNTAAFTVINATMFRAAAFADPERLVDIYQNGPDGSPAVNSYPAFVDMTAYPQVFAAIAAASIPWPLDYRDQGAVRTAIAEFATADYPAVLGLRPVHGRWFDASEDAPGAAIVAVVGHETWQRRFAADPSIVGRTIWIHGVPVAIVGVGPEGHRGTLNVGLVTDFWLPVHSLPALGGPPRALTRRPVESLFFVKARLRDGVTLAQARSAMDALGARLARDYPREDAGKGITVLRSTDVRIHPQADVPIAAVALVLLVVVGLVLAIACSNLATLVLVRGAARAKDVSVRLALGATRPQLVRHLLLESVLLSLCGGLAGCLLAWWATRALSAVPLPVSVDFSVDGRVLAFAIAVSLATGIAFGLAPALASTKVDLLPALRDESGPRSREQRWLTMKNALIVFQVATSVVLLSATGVFLRTLVAARAQRPGFAVDGVAMLGTNTRYAGYSGAASAGVYDTLRRRVAGIPGVESTTLTDGDPMLTVGLPIVIEGRAPGEAAVANAVSAGPGFFETMRIPILLGRAIDERDRATAPRVAVITESMAKRYFGGSAALGRRFHVAQDDNWMEVVGIARDTKTADLSGDLVEPTPDLFFRSPNQWGNGPTTIVARTSLDAGSLVAAMQRELRALDPSLPALSAKTMAQHLEASLAGPRAVTAFLGVLGALGLGLAGIGLYAVVAFAVARRAREIGIRMALGARRSHVVWRVARETTVLVAAGTGAGLALATTVVFALRAFTSTGAPGAYRPGLDALSLLAIVVFMGGVGVMAAWLPARRAATVDPLVALRHD